jgi:acyl-CoA synthetase (AMP-forming)/AMP-acid ligase II
MSLGVLIEGSYWRYARRPAIVHRGQRVTFAELGQRVHRLANAFLSFGLVPEDRIIIFLDNSPEFLETEQALFTTGLVRVALNTRLNPREVVQIANDCEARLIVTNASNAVELGVLRTEMPTVSVVVAVDSPAGEGVVPYEETAQSSSPEGPGIPAPRGDAVAALMYTSGTTGMPKGATITHHNWVSMIRNLMAELPIIYDTDLVLHAAPMSHLSGSIGTAYSAKGAAQSFLARFDPRQALKSVEESGVTVVPSVPTMLNALTSACESESFDVSSLRAIPYGGSAIAPQSLARAFDVFGEVLVQVYGLSEALVPLAALSPAGHSYEKGRPLPSRLSSAGRVSPFAELRIIGESGSELSQGEVGEVTVRGDTVMAGYWRRPDLTAEMIDDEGWARTGDVGFVDDDGFLHIVDRKKDVIVSGGFNIYPAEVERVIAGLEEVSEVVVVGTPSERWGEAVKAVVVVRPGFELDADRVVDVCRRNLASYKKPVEVEFVDHLPKGSTGKILRRELRDREWSGKERRVGQ